jgi:hypothetical protein
LQPEHVLVSFEFQICIIGVLAAFFISNKALFWINGYDLSTLYQKARFIEEELTAGDMVFDINRVEGGVLIGE